MISGDGRYVAFVSQASNLVMGGNPEWANIFIKELQTGTTTLISSTWSGAPANGESRSPAVSADGRYVAFQSEASNLVPGDNNGWTMCSSRIGRRA